ncbi:arylsulfatase [Algisphaera agarilytica]|uniref:Arylsulfatase A-like enzyme n=1 Tax=Algisphaera agarilytica TaxID=1385975 RepID=A0A7X0H9L2_9BACT|nr:arylsulfatase [Algisphaera agarilytica]MBB6431741.1 arylsulfatase A-like enzyme [Algisphaera agarilytica]
MNKNRPNVLVIVTDDQGYGDFSCSGNPWLKTPELDRFHDDAVRLQQFHTDPMCAPSRAALMTGCYSARAGVWSTLTGRYFLNRDMPTMADHFRAGGYRTGMFGKWHLGDSRRYLPHDRGFDEALYHGGGVIGEMPDRWDNDYFNAVFWRNGVPERFEDTYCTDVWCHEASEFIRRSVADEQPFFCYLPLNAPHSPYDVHADYAKPYLDQGVPHDRAHFFGMIANIDENVGKLRQHLEDLGIADDTIIVYTGDNGTACGATVDHEGFVAEGYNAGLRGKKCWSTDGGHRNLCMIRWANGGWSGGRDVDQLTAHFDLVPTLIEQCDLAGEASAPSRFDGHDLSQALQGEHDEQLDERAIVVHNQQRDNPEKYKDFAVMTRDWRLCQTTDWGPGRRELTRADHDVEQRQDVSEQHPEVVAQLMGVYEAWWEELDAGFDQVWPFYLSQDDDSVMMTAHAWHGVDRPPGIYDQNHCRLGVPQNGYWLIEVADAGRYTFEFRRWPREVDAPMTAGLPARIGVPHVSDRPEGASLSFKRAKLAIHDVDVDQQGDSVALVDQAITPDLCHVTLVADLSPGRYRVQAWLIDENKIDRGAYYCYVNQIRD